MPADCERILGRDKEDEQKIARRSQSYVERFFAKSDAVAGQKTPQDAGMLMNSLVYMNKFMIPLLRAQNSVYGPLDYFFLKTLIEENHIRNVLDVGTGDGSFILGLARKEPKVKFLGIDTSRELINYAQKNKIQLKDKRVTFDCRYFDEKFPMNGFDLVVARFAVEHADSVDNFTKAVFRRLRRGGYFAVIEYYVDNGSISDPVWREFRKRELALYKKIKAHPHLGMTLPLSLSSHGFKNIRSSFLQISPSTVGAKAFYHLMKITGQVYVQINPAVWPKTFANKLDRWCSKMSKRKDMDPMLFLTHTVGQKR